MKIKLSDTIKKTSRCLVRRAHIDVFKKLEGDGVWALRTVGEERQVWERLLVNDLVILWTQAEKKFVFLAIEIIGKSLDLSEPKSGFPLLLLCEIHGQAKQNNFSLHGYNFRHDMYCPVGIFSDLWDICSPVSISKGNVSIDPRFSIWKDIKLRIAVSQDDFGYLEEYAKKHSFGYRKAFLTIIAYKDSEILGALLCEPSNSVKHPHNATKLVFGNYYRHIRDDSLSVVRIFDSGKSVGKWKVHEALLRGIIEIAPFLVDGSLRIIEAVSYDYHPLATKLGFIVEIPSRPHDSIYYWKPFGIDKTYVQKRKIQEEDIKEAVHELLEQREEITYFAVYAPKYRLKKAIERNIWAISDNRTTNRGHWKTLRKGNLVFFISNCQYLEGYGVVEKICYDKNIPRYPLRIDFSRLDIPYVSVDVTEEPLSKWITLPHRGGIFKLGNRAGSELKYIVDQRLSEGKMWVKPNAFLLPETEFMETPNQIFVVQSWDLRNTILPMIRSIFSDKGFEVIHAEDREGQIVFGDVWRMLNEAEFVLVDFTEKRPNVYLEYGMALVLGKPIIAITQNLSDLPSDTPGLKAIEYSNSFSGMESLKSRLIKAVEDRRQDFKEIKSR